MKLESYAIISIESYAILVSNPMASPNHEDVESVDPSFMMFDQVVGCIEDVLISKYVFAKFAWNECRHDRVDFIA